MSNYIFNYTHLKYICQQVEVNIFYGLLLLFYVAFYYKLLYFFAYSTVETFNTRGNSIPLSFLYTAYLTFNLSFTLN